MASNIVQAGAGTIQAVSSLVDASSNLGDLALRVAQAGETLKNSHSRMKGKMVELREIRGSVEDKFRIYWFPRKQFDDWLRKVEAIAGQVGELTTKFSNSQDTSLIHFPSRLGLIKAIDTMCTEIDKVITQGIELADALVKRETKRIVKLATPISIANISTLKAKLEQILEYLKDESYNTIRLHGAAGTGKRAIIEHLNNHEAIANNMFDIVLWLPASDFENHGNNSITEAGIQHIIARRLGLSIGGSEDVNIIASKIRAELDGAKYLLLLNDVKRYIKLDTIGIPRDTKGSKIVFTTSVKYVVCQFGEPFNIEIGRLSLKDAYQMFEDILINENDMIQQHEIGTIALKVVKWCDGLFSLIKMVAKNFKSKRSAQSWSDGLQTLRKPAQKGDMYMQALKNFLHFSYDGLEDNQKLCFLFGALYPEDSKIPIDCLFDCWRAHRFLEYGAVENGGVTGQEILEHLLEVALLNECSNKQYVAMDKIFKAVAMKILQQHDQFKCLVEEEALEKLQKNSCLDTHWISLANSEIHVLPAMVMCPELTTLFLQKNSKLENISSSFFDHMKKLIILNLYETGIVSLPPMCNLPSLKVLYMNGCNILTKLPFNVEGLDNLEVLGIRGSIINEMPCDIKRLERLRRLIVSIPGDGNLSHLMISQPPSLKELIIDVKSDIVPVDEDSYMSWCNKRIEDIIEKIDTLKDLTTLQFRFKDEIVDVIQVRGDALKIFVPSQGRLKHVLHERRDLHSKALQIYIGFRMSSNLEVPRCFYGYDSFVLSCEKIVNDRVIEQVLVQAKALIMMKDNSIEHLDHVGISSSCMSHIQGCLVHKCSKIETLMQTTGFSNLKTLVVSECFQLKVLFSNDVVQQVMEIEHLEIRDCSAIEEINMLSTSGVRDIFPKLTTLVLYNLRRLTSICSVMEWPFLKRLQVHGCCMLTELPLNTNSAKNLLIIEVEKMWWENLQSSHEIKQKFEHLCKFQGHASSAMRSVV